MKILVFTVAILFSSLAFANPRTFNFPVQVAPVIVTQPIVTQFQVIQPIQTFAVVTPIVQVAQPVAVVPVIAVRTPRFPILNAIFTRNRLISVPVVVAPVQAVQFQQVQQVQAVQQQKQCPNCNR